MAELEIKNKQTENSLSVSETGFNLKTRDPTPGRSDTDDSSSGGSVTSEPGSHVVNEPGGLKEIEITCDPKTEETDMNFQDQLRLSPEGKAHCEASSDTPNSAKNAQDSNLDKSAFNDGDILSSTGTKSNGLSAHEIAANRNQGVRVVVGAADDDNREKKDKNCSNYYSSSSNSYQNAEATWTSKTTTMLTSLHPHHPNIRKIETQSNPGAGVNHPGNYHYG